MLRSNPPVTAKQSQSFRSNDSHALGLPFRTQSAPSVSLILFGLLALLVPISWNYEVEGKEPPAGQRARAYAAAGEFGPARDAARGLPEGAQRDQVLAEIAVFQAQHGAMGGASSSLRDVRSDQKRTQAIDTIAQTPLGGARGGAAMADFDTLIDLITSTVHTESWLEEGGSGTIESFPTGVYVDARGLLRQAATESKTLDLVRREATRATGPRDAARTSGLRKVSLPRLERAMQLAWMEGRPPDEAMRYLAGLHRIEYVLVYPDCGELIVAGPAGDWIHTDEGWTLNKETRSPVIQLDDLVVLLRRAKGGEGPFGCAIKPRRENLERTQQLLQESAKQPLRISQRAEWLERVRDSVGRQDIEVFGIDPHSRAARILVEADYHMKLIGIGREDGTLGVPSYMDLLAERGGQDAKLDVLRWWFAMHYDAVRSNASGDAFQFVGQAVKLLSENELLTARGERIQTGKAEELNRAFAAGFTKNFALLAQKYPIYGELRNVFDLALVAHLLEQQGLADQVAWSAMHWSDPRRFSVAHERVPREVESVANYQKTSRGLFTAVVGGGVHADPPLWFTPEHAAEDRQGELGYVRGDSAAKPQLPADAWWWD
jgi:hypothetical protein